MTEGLPTIPLHLTGKRLLVVDDARLNRTMLASTLEQAGFTQVKEAEDGVRALDLIKTWQPDLMLLDLIMPGIDGMEVCRRVMDMSPDERPIIVVQTAMTDSEACHTLLAMGADDYLKKPIQPQELLARCRVHLERKQRVQDARAFQRTLSADLQEAAWLQQSILPTTTQLRQAAMSYGLQIAGHAYPSRQIGGDIWGIRHVSADEILVYLADFSGNGIRAAMNTFRLHTLMNGPDLPIYDPSKLLAELNRRFCHLLPRGEFATMLVLLVNRAEGKIRIASAGALPPFMLRESDKDPFRPICRGMPLGVHTESVYEEQTLLFRHGHVLMLSDGLLENPNTGTDTLDEVSLGELLNRGSGNLHDALSLVVTHCLNQLADAETDDQTAVLIKTT